MNGFEHGKTHRRLPVLENTNWDFDFMTDALNRAEHGLTSGRKPRKLFMPEESAIQQAMRLMEVDRDKAVKLLQAIHYSK